MSEEVDTVKKVKKTTKKKTRIQVEVDTDENAYGYQPQNDELIFSGEYTKAMNKDWHSGHFCCWQCDESLTGQRYVLRDEHPYCVRCYEQVFANSCEECSKAIGIDSKFGTSKGRRFGVWGTTAIMSEEVDTVKKVKKTTKKKTRIQVEVDTDENAYGYQPQNDE
ncbi:putative LIM domain-containing protein, partial [Ixodes scapularis]